MPTLFLSRTCQPEADQLATLAQLARWGLRWLKGRRLPDRLPGKELAFYGETDKARRLMQNHSLALLEPTFGLLSQMPRRYTLREIRSMTLGDALTLPDRAFVKPADCTNKCFDAAVCEAGKYLFCADDLPRTTEVIVSEPVSWEVEYRVIVLEGKIVTFSPYIRGGWLARDAEGRWSYPENEAEGMLDFCHTLLADVDVSLPPVVTLDVGLIEGRGWAVVEFNPVWCSGLLGCDLRPMLAVLERACRRQSELSPADAAWAIDRDRPPATVLDGTR